MSTTYFQGGDYIELLSAQGATPAATWKLQGKITKAFEKTIRGNAFVLDGGTETKMQLPKNPSQPALGVAQRFLILQLQIPLARSFAVEIGFADFQKIRRRFVFASAFRETVMNALHVQIPFGVSVTRDRWMNLVFDLQALTETYFTGSTFRSVESLYISGSCKLKRVFTMKDAPAWDHRQQPVSGAGSVLVASHADMREIPKQFVFTTTTSGSAPIPTEYFILPACVNTGSNTAKRESGATHAKAIPSGVRKATTATPRTHATSRPSNEPTRSMKARPSSGNGVLAVERIQASSPASVVVPSPVAARREASPTAPRPSSSSTRPTTTASRLGTRMSRDELQLLPPTPLPMRESVDSSRFDESADDDIEQLHDSPAKSSNKRSCASKEQEDDGRLVSASPVFERRSFVTRDPMDLHASKEQCRQAIVTEIQQKLDQLTASEELGEERNQKLFLQHTSLRSSVGLGLEEAWDLRTRSLRSSVAVEDLYDAPHEAAGDLRNKVSQQIAKTAEPSSCKRGNNNGLTHDRKIHAVDSARPEQSIFAFSSSHVDDSSSVKSLYDFDSLLDSTAELKRSSTTESSRPPSRAVPSNPPSLKVNGDTITQSRSPSVALSVEAKAQEEEDELTLLLAAKRLARQWQREGRQYLMQAEQQPAHVAGKREESDSSGRELMVPHEDATQVEAKVDVEKADCDAIEGAAIEDERGSDEDDDLSIDLADELDQAVLSDLDDPNEGSHDASFDFGDLVQDQQSEHEQQHIKEQSVSIDKQSQRSPQPQAHASPDKRTAVSRRQEQAKSARSAFSLPEAKLASPTTSITNSSTLVQTSGSSHRLQTLLDSTDWSQLAHSPMPDGTSSVLQQRESRQQTQQPSFALSPNSAGSTSIELVYDPLLHCYYDPVANKYYALAK